MKKLLLILLCVPLIGVGQEFEQIFVPNGYTDAISAKSLQTSDGGYAIYASASNYVSGVWKTDAVLIKEDMYGSQNWVQTFDDGDDDWASDFIVTDDGGFLLLKIKTYDNTGSIIKTDGNGNQIWEVNTSSIKVNELSDIIETSDGGYIYTGYKSIDTSLNQLHQEISAVKIDALGNELWVSDNLGPQVNGKACSIEETNVGSYIITGFIGTQGGVSWISHIFTFPIMIKFDNNGNQQWERTLTFNGAIHSVKETLDGGFITSGLTAGEPNIFIMKTDNNGFQLWYNDYLSDSITYGHSDPAYYSTGDIINTNDGGYALTASSFNNNKIINRDLCLMKIDGQGNKDWIKTFNLPNDLNNGNSINNGISIQSTSNGGYIISGSSFDDIFNNSIYIIRTNSQGNVTSEFTIPINSNRELEKVVDILGRDIKPEKNKPFIEIYNDGTVEKKIIIE